MLLCLLAVTTGTADATEKFDRKLRLEVVLPPHVSAGVDQQIHCIISGTEGRTVSIYATARRPDAARESGEEIFRVTVQADGTLHPVFQLKDDMIGPVRLTVTAESPDGIQRLFKDLRVEPEPLVTYISTDKPLYQPGQTVHIRSISFDPVTHSAASDRSVTLTVRNPQGVMVWQQKVRTGDFGVAAHHFGLATGIPTGSYKVVVTVGSNETELPFEVREYKLPKFIIKIDTDKAWYKADQSVDATITATYTFGEPVRDAEVRLSLVAFNAVSGYEMGTLSDLTGKTDDKGRWLVNWRVPDNAKQYFDAANRFPISMRVTVTDKGGLTELTSAMRVIAKDALTVQLFPEDNMIVPGVENRMFVVVSYPDGSPAPSTLNIARLGGDDMDTNDRGIGQFMFTPKADGNGNEFLQDEWKIKAVDNEGNRPELVWKYENQGTSPRARLGTVRLRPSSHVLGQSEMPRVTIDRTPGAEKPTDGKLLGYTLEVRKLGHTVLVRDISTSELGGDTSGVEVTLPATLFGELQFVLHELREVPQPGADAVGGRTSERRMIPNVSATTVFRAKEDHIDIEVVPSLEQYAPGQPGEITLQAKRASGERGPLMIGVDIVDTALFGLASDEREDLQLAFLVRRSVLADNLNRYLVQPGVTAQERELLAAVMFARHAEDPAGLPSEDSLTFANQRTMIVMERLSNMLRLNKPWFTFRGQYHKPFEWLLANAATTGLNDDDLYDAWGNKLELLPRYNGNNKWTLVSPGPDGKRNVDRRDAPENKDDIVIVVDGK